MPGGWNKLVERVRPKKYGRKQPLVLLNGLAEQHESWYRNVRFWSRYFDVYQPQLLAYGGDFLHARIKADQEITIDFLVEQLHRYLHQYVQTPPYHLCCSSLGGKVGVEFAVRYPELISRLVLLCPSGMGDVERLPIMEGVRRSDYEAIVRAVFFKPRKADRGLLTYYRKQFENRRWKLGLVRTVKGTNETVVRPKLKLINSPTLFIGAREDKIVDPLEGERAAQELPNGWSLMLPDCGHAPQIEKAWLINRLIVHFLTSKNPSAHPNFVRLLLNKPTRANL